MTLPTRYSQTRLDLAREIAPDRSGATLRSYLTDLDALGLEREIVPGVAALAERAAGLRTHQRHAPGAARAASDDIAARLARGDIDADQAATEIASHVALVAADSAVVDVVKKATAKAEATAVDLLRRAGEDTFVNAMRPIIGAALTAAAGVSKKLDGISAADEATAAGTVTAAAWSTLVAAHGRWLAAHQLLDRLRSNGILPATGTDGRRGYLVAHEHRWARPDLGPNARRHPEPRELIDYPDAGPGIYTSAEAQAAVAAIIDGEPAEDLGLRGRPRYYGHGTNSSRIASEVAAIVGGHLPAA